MSPSTVLVTGASRFVGGQLAARLAADPTIDRVLAVDAVLPRPELSRRLGRAEFVPIDLRSPSIAKVISDAKVDTVVHASLSATPGSSGGPKNGRSAMKELNVIGTMQLLAACQRSTTVTRLVVKSTAAVYGISSHDQAVFTERDEPNGFRNPDMPRTPWRSRATSVVSLGGARMWTSRYCASPTSSVRVSIPR